MIKRWIDRTFKEDLFLLISQFRLVQKLLSLRMAEFKRNTGLRFASPYLSMLIHIVLLGGIMGAVFGEDFSTFLPYFGISFCVWQSLSIYISESADINQITRRYSNFPNISGLMVGTVLLYQNMAFGIIRFLAVITALIFINRPILMNANWIGAGLGYIELVVLLFVWIVPCAYFFSVFRIVKGFLPQILLAINLVTPIFWPTGKLSGYSWVYLYNPVYHVIEIIRAPILQGRFNLLSISVVGLLIVVGLILSFVCYKRNKCQIVYDWVN